MGYFDIKRDMEMVRAGGFFCCQGCLVCKPLDNQSQDSRYCEGCFAFLMNEASLLPPSKHPKWIPKSQKIAGAKPIPVPQDVVLNMSTLADKKIKVDIIHPPGGKVTHKKRGPKQKDLPVDLITQWDGEGMGSKGIAARLKKEYSITVSYKTIQRILSGQRVMV